jgi:hypothetical protein
MSRVTELPEWTESAGGSAAWRNWITRRVRSCCRRAQDWARTQRTPPQRLPTASEWRGAIVKALCSSDGRGYYSHFFLSVEPSRGETAWDWPSVDHRGGPASTDVVLETRLVNDMKTIMSEAEFLELIGHIAAVRKVEVRPRYDWSCQRSFAKEQSADEPPLPGLAEGNR